MIADFSKKRNRKFFSDNFLFQIAGILFLIITVVLVFANFKMDQKKKELASQVNFYEKQIEDIKKTSQRLEDEIANSDNIDYLEKIAYEQLGQQKPGEKGVIFIAPQEKQKEDSKSENFWTGWFVGAWNWLKSKF